MAKIIGEPVQVHQKGAAITAFIWRKRLYRVSEVVGWWREPAEWWHGKAVRLFIRVSARNSSDGTYELYRLGGEWFLQRVID